VAEPPRFLGGKAYKDVNNLVLFYPDIPISTNKLYYNRPGGGRGLTSKANAYKNRVINWLVQAFLNNGVLAFDPSAMYEIRFLFFLERIQQKTWPDKAQRRFKKEDVDNLVKLLLDSLSSAMQVDDRNFFSVTSMKAEFPLTGVGISLQQINEKTWDKKDVDMAAMMAARLVVSNSTESTSIDDFFSMVEEAHGTT